MENPLSGVMEWYQGLPQAAQIGIPVVGAGAVFLIAKGKGGGGTGGAVVAGPFGSSSGGGSGNTGGNTPPPTPTPKPKPQPHPFKPPVRPKPRPKPPGTGGGHPVKPPTKPFGKGMPIPKAIPIGKKPTQPHLAPTHVLNTDTRKGHLPSSHIIDHSQFNSKAGAVGWTLANQRGLQNANKAMAMDKPKITPSTPVITGAAHPVNQHALRNRVGAAKTHQTANDKNRHTATTLTKQRGIHQAIL